MSNQNNKKSVQVWDIRNLLKQFDIFPKNYKYYVEALTHNSYNNEKKVGYTYQRLEFLGDALIQKLISVFLFKNQNLDEQQMTEIRKNLVKTETFRKASEELNLINYAFIGKGINLEKDTLKIKCDLFESIAGAIFLDLGEDAVFKFLENTILKYYYNNELVDPIDYKSRIQELFQSNISSRLKKAHICYQTVELEDGSFKAVLHFDNIVYGTGSGKTKKDAQKAAAKMAYEKYVYQNEEGNKENE
ncbi:MAG: ribonuclease III [Malacoplasma sp.]|nr:ribonuclease III [Malacoplasma sp.]